MHLIHLGLPVRDQERSIRFYGEHFAFDQATAQRYPDGTVIIRNEDGFDLALHAVQDGGQPQPFLHFGFRMDTASDVSAALDRIRAAGIKVIEQDEESFKCLDPDGHRIEVYCEP